METLKITGKTLKAARLAADKAGVDFNKWAEKVLANAAAPNRRSSIESMIRDISFKIDKLADQKTIDEKHEPLLGAAIGDIGSSFRQIGKSTKRVMRRARTKTSSAVGEVVGEVAAIARGAVGHGSKSDAGAVEPDSVKTVREDEAIGKEKKKAAPRRGVGRSKAVKATDTP